MSTKGGGEWVPKGKKKRKKHGEKKKKKKFLSTEKILKDEALGEGNGGESGQASKRKSKGPTNNTCRSLNVSWREKNKRFSGERRRCAIKASRNPENVSDAVSLRNNWGGIWTKKTRGGDLDT